MYVVREVTTGREQNKTCMYLTDGKMDARREFDMARGTPYPYSRAGRRKVMS